jgi:hypothetical protein
MAAVFFMSYSAFSQSTEERLSKVYSASELTQIQQESPEKLKMLNYALDNACYIADIPTGKEVDLPNISLKDTKTTPCFADLGLRIEQQNQYFRIQGSNKMLVVKSEWVLNYEMEKAH